MACRVTGCISPAPPLAGRIHAGRIHAGRIHAGRIHAGRIHAGRIHAGQIRQAAMKTPHPESEWGVGMARGCDGACQCRGLSSSSANSSALASRMTSSQAACWAS